MASGGQEYLLEELHLIHSALLEQSVNLNIWRKPVPSTTLKAPSRMTALECHSSERKGFLGTTLAEESIHRSVVGDRIKSTALSCHILLEVVCILCQPRCLVTTFGRGFEKPFLCSRLKHAYRATLRSDALENCVSRTKDAGFENAACTILLNQRIQENPSYKRISRCDCAAPVEGIGRLELEKDEINASSGGAPRKTPNSATTDASCRCAYSVAAAPHDSRTPVVLIEFHLPHKSIVDLERPLDDGVQDGWVRALATGKTASYTRLRVNDDLEVGHGELHFLLQGLHRLQDREFPARIDTESERKPESRRRSTDPPILLKILR
ncbi:hypothetical protein SELMODRAFT_403699 [Selaginella moellendorffii]|uniref:Uncharacterized protein n=1 Tax=Selaginella moellendorffii TaxID=88036 RepID=D8QS87_SELML|nr:hypothetical protein SELMODRAFT_403699 [Selaginella moellendorffii]